MGRSKALETIGGKSLIEGVIERLKQLTSQILIVTAKEKFDLPLSVKAKVATDIYPNKGPLGGIYTGLVTSRSVYNIVVACDMPFINTGLLHYMIELSPGFEAVVPRLAPEGVEPLHAIYSKSCSDKMKIALQHNQLGVHSFLNAVRVRYVEREECQRLDPQLLCFFNINRQADLERAIALAKNKDSH